MISEVNVTNTAVSMFIDLKPWTINDLLDFDMLLDCEKAAIRDKMAKGELNVPEENKGQQKNQLNPSPMDGKS